MTPERPKTAPPENRRVLSSGERITRAGKLILTK